MKKTQIALAALALVASTAAMADGVTIYGNLEAGLVNSSTDKKATYLSGTGAFTAGNLMGFKGEEDLGGGMKASFVLEAGLNLNGGVDNGGNNGGLFSRLANIGLSSAAGSVKLGQQLTPFVASVAGTGTLGNGNFFVNRLVMGGAFAPAGIADDHTMFHYSGFFIPNAASYTSPSIQGFTVTALTSTKTGANQGAVPNSNEGDSYQAYSLDGAIGGVNVSAAYQTRKLNYTTTALSANYKLGDVTLAGNWMTNKITTTDLKTGSYNIGAGYDLTDAVNVNLQFAHNDIAAANQSITALGAQYKLSKRTFIFAQYSNATHGAQSNYDERGSWAKSGSRNHTYSAGVAHSF
jgi:predicted porin